MDSFFDIIPSEIVIGIFDMLPDEDLWEIGRTCTTGLNYAVYAQTGKFEETIRLAISKFNMIIVEKGEVTDSIGDLSCDDDFDDDFAASLYPDDSPVVVRRHARGVDLEF